MDSCNNNALGEPFPGLYDALKARTSQPNRFPGHTGISITHVSRDRAVGELEVTETTLNALRNVHGGALLALADTVCGAAAATRANLCNTLDCHMSFLRPGLPDGRVICTAEAERVGRTICVYRAVITDGDGTVLATGTFTFFVLKKLTPEIVRAQVEDTE